MLWLFRILNNIFRKYVWKSNIKRWRQVHDTYNLYFHSNDSFLCCVINRLWGAFFQQNQFIRIFPYSHNFNLFQWSVQWYNNIILFKKTSFIVESTIMTSWYCLISFFLHFVFVFLQISCHECFDYANRLKLLLVLYSSFKNKKKQSCNNLWEKNIHWKKKKNKKK